MINSLNSPYFLTFRGGKSVFVCINNGVNFIFALYGEDEVLICDACAIKFCFSVRHEGGGAVIDNASVLKFTQHGEVYALAVGEGCTVLYTFFTGRDLL